MQICGGIPDPDEPLPVGDRYARDREPAPGAVGSPGTAEEGRKVCTVLQSLQKQPCGGFIIEGRQKVLIEERAYVRPDGVFLSDGKSPCKGRVVPADPPVIAYHEKAVLESVKHRAIAECPVLI
ncbi:MAG: hypothetical protein XD82_0098 [Methanoculleus marisnigri]|uniref:Uncharacterized protein n=1 Tax=Methanoculleus marisnigri TaxID=2198 RepID=A0A117LRR3_9EURY|nr:MAG: hypothetical protein XD82_0098 [Methanoculleus marisnigri]